MFILGYEWKILKYLGHIRLFRKRNSNVLKHKTKINFNILQSNIYQVYIDESIYIELECIVLYDEINTSFQWNMF